MYGFGGVGLSEVQISISELSVTGGLDKRTSWSDLVGVRQLLSKCIFTHLVCRTFYNTSNPPPATVKEKAEKEKKGIVSVIAFSHLFRKKC